MGKKKTYQLGRKHHQFYITFDEKKGEYIIKFIPREYNEEKILDLIVQDHSLYMGTYAECQAFKHGYTAGYNIMKTYLKSNLERYMGEIANHVFNHNIRMEDAPEKTSKKKNVGK